MGVSFCALRMGSRRSVRVNGRTRSGQSADARGKGQPLRHAEEGAGEGRQRSNQNGSGKEEVVVVLSEAVAHVAAQPVAAEERSDRFGGHHLHRGDPDAGQDDGRSECHLDAEDHDGAR